MMWEVNMNKPAKKNIYLVAMLCFAIACFCHQVNDNGDKNNAEKYNTTNEKIATKIRNLKTKQSIKHAVAGEIW